jgi:hypothetical protein
MTDYFNSDAIGSSLLASVIASFRDNEIVFCFDRATIPVKPTSSMEIGKMFEDLVETTIGGKWDFWEKYFTSDMNSIPEYKGERTDISQILEILDMGKEEIRQAVGVEKPGWAYMTKKGGFLHGSYKSRHRMLDQIRAHNYRRPIPKPTWEKLEIMLERFMNYPFEFSGVEKTISEWLESGLIKCEFQVEHFWETEHPTMGEGGFAKCRAKYDMIWFWVDGDGDMHGILFDLKVTEDKIDDLKSIHVFNRNWRTRYIWQSKHYHEGFKDYCAKNGIIPHPVIWYLIQESEEPQVTYGRALSELELEELSGPYRETLFKTQEWIDRGKPVKGYMRQQKVDRYGREA